MKPKTKLQKKIVKLAKKLDPVSEEDKQWANDALFDGYYVRVRNRNYCLECGHKWNPQDAELSHSVIEPTCPDCGVKNLERIHNWEVDERVYEYWAIIDVVEGYQLVRMFQAKKYMKRKQPAIYHHNEVMQHWVREDGKTTSLAKLCSMMGSYSYLDSWSVGTELEVRTPSRNHKMRCNIAPYKIRPGRETLPIIRRNGYKGYFKDEAPHQFFSAILKYPKAETLLKAGQISLFKKCVGLENDIYEEIEKYWDSICIAIRNDYIIEDASDWFDYLGFLDELGKDLHNPNYVCPENFKEEHDRYAEKIRKIREREREEKRRKKMLEDEAKYVESKGCFFDLELKAGGIKIVPLKSVKEFIKEGEKLHHCIGSSRYYNKDNRLILSARIDGQPVETVEVNLSKMKVTQARGLQNQPTEYHDTIVDAVRKNMGKIAKRKQQTEVAA